MTDEVLDIKGDILTLDTQSKIVVSFLMIIGVALSIEPFQVLVFAFMSIPIIFFYRPSITFLKKMIYILPIFVFMLLIFTVSFENEVTIHLLWFERKYEPLAFAQLLSFRLFVSALHTSILIESEPTVFNVIQALSKLKVSQFLITIILLISRMGTIIFIDYNRMVLAAKSRGGIRGNIVKNVFLRVQILGKLLSINIKQSDEMADMLSARGFDGKFTSSVRGWTSEGLTIVAIASVFWVITVMTPLLRVR